MQSIIIIVFKKIFSASLSQIEIRMLCQKVFKMTSQELSAEVVPFALKILQYCYKIGIMFKELMYASIAEQP